MIFVLTRDMDNNYAYYVSEFETPEEAINFVSTGDFAVGDYKFICGNKMKLDLKSVLKED